jgi:hypothetical protein
MKENLIQTMDYLAVSPNAKLVLGPIEECFKKPFDGYNPLKNESPYSEMAKWLKYITHNLKLDFHIDETEQVIYFRPDPSRTAES